jgi:two-component system phosphate regulon sensor histidine kinase PhoR
VADIQSYVGADAGKVIFASDAVDLFAAAADAATMLESEFAKKRQRVHVTIPATLVMACGDAARVRQVIVNLLTNAHKYSPPATEVTLECGATAAVVYVDVCDHGPGIPAEECESIFEPFVQLPGGEAERAGGIGLGLSIARELARGMRGGLTVRAGAAGGAVFRLSLPSAA